MPVYTADIQCAPFRVSINKAYVLQIVEKHAECAITFESDASEDLFWRELENDVNLWLISRITCMQLDMERWMSYREKQKLMKEQFSKYNISTEETYDGYIHSYIVRVMAACEIPNGFRFVNGVAVYRLSTTE